MSLSELQAVERRRVVPSYTRLPVEFVRGEGARLWDDEGNEYLDFLAGISVSSVGHCHPAVVAAVREQAGRLMHVTNLFYTELPMRLAERLSERSLGGKVFFSNSGAEAVEAAIKLARKARRGGKIVVAEQAFHGRTYGALSATPQESKQEPFAPLVPGFVVVPKDPAALDAAVDEDTAAVLLEPVQGETGIHVLSDELLRTARAACDRSGAALIFDEIQCGMGRTGTLWAHEHGDHGSTFAGGPVVAAAALAALDVVDDAVLLARVNDLGERLAAGLGDLPGVREVRGRGLMRAIEIEGGPALVRRALFEQRLVLNATGPTTVRFLPPLTVGEAEIDDALRRVTGLLA